MSSKYTKLAKLAGVISVISALGYQSLAMANQTQQHLETELLWSVSGFDQPESTVFMPHLSAYLVSNINGAPMELNGKGYISKVSADGKLLERNWARGFDAPKGIAQYQNQVYVADMKQLVQLDGTTGKIVNRFIAPMSKMLNDIAIDEAGNVFVSDLIGGGVYRLTDDELVQMIDAATLPHPNGLTFDNNRLTIASWGEGLQADFSTQTLGSAYQLTPKAHTADKWNKTLEPISQPIGNLDGIERFNDFFITNDWINGKVFAVNAGRSQLILEAGKGAADINIVKDQLVVPMMLDNRLDVYKLTH